MEPASRNPWKVSSNVAGVLEARERILHTRSRTPMSALANGSGRNIPTHFGQHSQRIAAEPYPEKIAIANLNEQVNPDLEDHNLRRLASTPERVIQSGFSRPPFQASSSRPQLQRNTPSPTNNRSKSPHTTSSTRPSRVPVTASYSQSDMAAPAPRGTGLRGHPRPAAQVDLDLRGPQPRATTRQTTSPQPTSDVNFSFAPTSRPDPQKFSPQAENREASPSSPTSRQAQDEDECTSPYFKLVRSRPPAGEVRETADFHKDEPSPQFATQDFSRPVSPAGARAGRRNSAPSDPHAAERDVMVELRSSSHHIDMDRNFDMDGSHDIVEQPRNRPQKMYSFADDQVDFEPKPSPKPAKVNDSTDSMSYAEQRAAFMQQRRRQVQELHQKLPQANPNHSAAPTPIQHQKVQVVDEGDPPRQPAPRIAMGRIPPPAPEFKPTHPVLPVSPARRPVSPVHDLETETGLVASTEYDDEQAKLSAWEAVQRREAELKSKSKALEDEWHRLEVTKRTALLKQVQVQLKNEAEKELEVFTRNCERSGEAAMRDLEAEMDTVEGAYNNFTAEIDAKIKALMKLREDATDKFNETRKANLKRRGEVNAAVDDAILQRQRRLDEKVAEQLRLIDREIAQNLKAY